MTISERETSLSRSFVPDKQNVAGFEFRPFSIGSLNLCRMMDITLVTGGGEPLDDNAKQDQCMSIAWMQSAPLKEVLRAVSAGTWRDNVLEFAFSVELDKLPGFIASITDSLARAAASAVEVQPRESDSDTGEKPPGNS